jgi:hypothetical protein
MSLLSYFLPVSEGCYHKSRCISQILVPVPELGVADICEAIPLRLVPPQTSARCGVCAESPVSKLGLPHEGERRLDLVQNHFAHNIPRVNIDCADCHHL